MSEIYSKKALLLGVVMLFSLSTYAQHKDHCGTSQAMKELYKAKPGAKTEALELSDFTKGFASKRTKAANEYVIPVVFHVFGTTFNGLSVTDDIIVDALQRTNDDFQGLTADWNDIIPEFESVKKALNITFKLAQIDPDGNPTTGINYYGYAAGFGNGSGYDAEIQKYAWDNYKYFNVYIQNDLYDDGATNNSGVCWYPNTWMSDNNLARCVYNGAYLGNNTNENFRSVLTHEFGHYLNLIHTFEGGCPDAGSCSTSGDEICDTPPADNSNMNGALNCQGVVTNWQNFMDYTSNYAMFTSDQVARMEAALQHSTRFPLWQDANLDATGVNADIGASLMISSTLFEERYQNDGAVESSATISATNGAQFATTGNLISGTHFTVTNVPAGLNVSIIVNTLNSATVSFTGNATAHANANDVSGIKITFLDPAISGGVSTLYSPDINNLKIDYIEPYQIIYENIADISVNSTDTWVWFSIQNGEAFGIWYDGGKLRLETYEKPLVCEGTSRNITKLPYEIEINSSSNWIAGGAYPDEHDLRTNSYKVWDGETAYIGFQFNYKGHPCYGWFKVTVASNGQSYTLTEYAYNEEPYASILAGTTNSGNGDTEAPTAPGNLTSSNITENSVDLSWTASTDNVGVTGYDVYQGSSVVQTVTGTSTSVTGLIANTNYTFSVKAKDAAGNVSTASNSVNVTTLDSSDDGGALTNAAAASGNMDQADGSDMWYIDVGTNASSLRVILETGSNDFDTYGKLGAEPTTSVYDWRGYTSGGEDNTVNNPQEGRHYIMVNHYSGSGAYTLTATITYNTADIEAPGAPANLTSSNITETSVDLSWTASTDNVGVIGYDVYQGSSIVQTITGTSTSVTGLTANTNYTFSVKAKDAAGNISVASNTINVTTQGGGSISYCTVSHSSPLDYFYIKNVSFGSINNSTQLGNLSTCYSDFTIQSTAVNRGAVYNLSVDWYPGWDANSAKVYIDWNQDGDFDDSGETVMDVAGTNLPYSVNVTVPTNAEIGNTRMRVRLTYNANIVPCGSLTYGETEDYTIIVNASAAGATSIENLTSGNTRIYPNPASEKLNILLFGVNNADIELINMSGQAILNKKFSDGKIELDISGLKKGMYLLRIISSNNILHKKVVLK